MRHLGGELAPRGRAATCGKQIGTRKPEPLGGFRFFKPLACRGDASVWLVVVIRWPSTGARRPPGRSGGIQNKLTWSPASSGAKTSKPSGSSRTG